MTPNPTFENVEPLLKDSGIDGRTMHMLFVCPATGAQVQASAEVPNLVSGGEAYGRAASEATIGGAEGYARESAFQAAEHALGGVGDVLDLFGGRWRRSHKTRAKIPIAGAEDHHAAVVNGFTSVADQFAWDGSRWVCRPPAPPAG